MSDSKTAVQAIKSNYGAVARSGLSTEHEGVKAIAKAFGYSEDELQSIPANANMGLSCGNPTALASLKPGEVVVDLGSGGGIDVFLAARQVGPTGRAIGIDMTQDMIELARRNAASSSDSESAPVEFHLGTIDQIPLPDSSVDCVISNCVINLADDKSAVFREIFRILKPGGRVAISDIALRKPLPSELATDIAALVGCIGGAIAIDEYQAGLRQTGFSSVQVIDAGADLNAYALVESQSACCSPAMAAETATATPRCTPPSETESACCETAGQPGCCSSPAVPATGTQTSGCCSAPAEQSKGVHEQLAGLIRKYDINEFAASVKVFALKQTI
jgi:arsenite methyltransferase